MKPVEIIKTESTIVSCNGTDALYGHPKVYLKIKENIGSVQCPYCSRQFQLNE